MQIAAIDPGNVIGFAIYSTERGYYDCWEHWDLEIENLANCDVIVLEKFVPRPGAKTHEPKAEQQIGVVKAFCEARNIRLAEQMPAARKWSTNNKLKALDWYFKTTDDHQIDATRHLLRFLVKEALLHADDVRRLRRVL